MKLLPVNANAVLTGTAIVLPAACLLLDGAAEFFPSAKGDINGVGFLVNQMEAFCNGFEREKHFLQMLYGVGFVHILPDEGAAVK